jgi:hypothetical protein
VAIKSFQHVVHSGHSRRAHLAALLVLASALLIGPAWATDTAPSLKDSHVQTLADLQGAGAEPTAPAVSINATWQIEMAYVVSDPASGVSQE